MLYLNTGHSPRQALQAEPHARMDAGQAVWLDLLRPTETERAAAAHATQLDVPPEAELAEIESSSRLSVEGDAIYLSTPMTYRGDDGMSLMAPLGFVLSPRHLLTVRFAGMRAFDSFADRFNASTGRGSTVTPCSVSAFVGLLEAIVDRLADVLEHVGGDLDGLSHQIFRPATGGSHNAANEDAKLRAVLRDVGLAGERVSNIRDSLLGVSRIVLYVNEVASSWIPEGLKPRFKTLRQDVASLSDHDNQLTNKVQFLLDATLGFINIEQANGIKVLTVVSVVGVPPTLIASIYGMNFKWIPELQWEYGYFYGITLIVLSAVVPLWWFKKRGWI